MYERRKKTGFESYVLQQQDSESKLKATLLAGLPCLSKVCCRDYLKFAFYCTMLIVPLYAISVSVLKHDWIMVIIDALLIPVGFVHGVLLLTGVIS